MWLRMLFSCLVDADFLDTEAFMEPERSARRRGYPTLAEMEPFFEKYMAEKTVNAADIYVNRLRAEVLLACREKAIQAPGLFTLTVPTGGGKTLSSLAFALKHALMHGKNRIIYVIPYTSIIEQTADQFRAIFGENVLEHHSNLDVDPSKENARSRLASENWDAPLIVTTNVQFFESLFASRTSRCRKIHNIVNSVVILDEAQNATAGQMKMFLTRLGAGSRAIVTGDATQTDLPSRATSGLVRARQILEGVDGISFIDFTKEDVVRHKLVKDIIAAYERAGEE